MEDNDVIYEVHAPMESEELAGKVMRAVGALGAYKIRIYAIEDGRRRPLRQKELAGVLLGATEPEPIASSRTCPRIRARSSSRCGGR